MPLKRVSQRTTQSDLMTQPMRSLSDEQRFSNVEARTTFSGKPIVNRNLRGHCDRSVVTKRRAEMLRPVLTEEWNNTMTSPTIQKVESEGVFSTRLRRLWT
jgi:hypothetical protein